MKVVIVGGVAGGASAAARIRRLDAVRFHLCPSLRRIQILSGRNTRGAGSAERLSLRRPVNKSFCYLPSRNLHIF